MFPYRFDASYIFTTQFQPASARKVFPCVDEPYFKTTFSISMKAPADYEAVSNGPVMDTKVVDGGKNKALSIFPPLDAFCTYRIFMDPLGGQFRDDHLYVDLPRRPRGRSFHQAVDAHQELQRQAQLIGAPRCLWIA